MFSTIRNHQLATSKTNTNPVPELFIISPSGYDDIWNLFFLISNIFYLILVVSKILQTMKIRSAKKIHPRRKVTIFFEENNYAPRVKVYPGNWILKIAQP